jgi:hypothetical protein
VNTAAKSIEPSSGTVKIRAIRKIQVAAMAQICSNCRPAAVGPARVQVW